MTDAAWYLMVQPDLADRPCEMSLSLSAQIGMMPAAVLPLASKLVR